MQTLTLETIMHICVNFIFFLVIGVLGAFLKDLYETLTKKNDPIRFGEVLIGGVCAAFITLGLQDNWLKDYSLNTKMLITFIGGILGFELFGNITTIAKFKKTIQTIISIQQGGTLDDEPSNIEEEGATEKKSPPKKTKVIKTARTRKKKDEA